MTGSSNARTDIKKLRPKIRAHFADLTGTRGFANLQTALHINKWLYICKRLVRSWLRSSIFTIRSRLEARPSIDIVELLVKDPRAFYELDWRKLEEIVAGAYKRKNFDVTLKPRSGDEGRDVIAVRHDVGSIRFFDQVKRYRPGHVVTLEEVHAMIGVLNCDRNVSKGIVTTTSKFAPGLEKAKGIKELIPYWLELKDRDKLPLWLESLLPRASWGGGWGQHCTRIA